MGKKKMVANRVIKSNKTSTIDFSNIEKSNRRTILTTLVSTGLLLKVDPSLSSYGDSANVFGKTTNKSGFLAYAGEGFSLLLPSKWNPSKERDFPDVALRYEDNFDAVNNLVVKKERHFIDSIFFLVLLMEMKVDGINLFLPLYLIIFYIFLKSKLVIKDGSKVLKKKRRAP